MKEFWIKTKYSLWISWTCFGLFFSCMFRKKMRTLAMAGLNSVDKANKTETNQKDRLTLDYIDWYCRKNAGFKPKQNDKVFFMAMAKSIRGEVD